MNTTRCTTNWGANSEHSRLARLRRAQQTTHNAFTWRRFAASHMFARWMVAAPAPPTMQTFWTLLSRSIDISPVLSRQVRRVLRFVRGQSPPALFCYCDILSVHKFRLGARDECARGGSCRRERTSMVLGLVACFIHSRPLFFSYSTNRQVLLVYWKAEIMIWVNGFFDRGTSFYVLTISHPSGYYFHIWLLVLVKMFREILNLVLIIFRYSLQMN